MLSKTVPTITQMCTFFYKLTRTVAIFFHKHCYLSIFFKAEKITTKLSFDHPCSLFSPLACFSTLKTSELNRLHPSSSADFAILPLYSWIQCERKSSSFLQRNSVPTQFAIWQSFINTIFYNVLFKFTFQWSLVRCKVRAKIFIVKK